MITAKAYIQAEFVGASSFGAERSALIGEAGVGEGDADTASSFDVGSDFG